MDRPPYVSLRTVAAICLVALIGCGNCSDAKQVTPDECPTGTRYNPISGECERGANPTPDVGNPATGDAAANNPPQGDMGGGGGDDMGPPAWGGPWLPPDDPSDIEFFSCEPEDYVELDRPTFVVDYTQNFMFGVPYGADIVEVGRADGGELASFVFEDEATGYTGFIIAAQPPGGLATVTDLADHVLDTLRAGAGYGSATVRDYGYQTTTHDRLQAIVEQEISLGPGVDLHTARDAILASLAGVQPQDLDHTLSTSIEGDGSNTVLGLQILRRGPNQYIVAGALARATQFDDLRHPVAHRVADITGGTAIAWSDARLAQECISYTVRETPEVDIIISLDTSGSMDAIRDQLAGFATQFTQLLDSENVDWRIGVTGVHCESIQSDMGISGEFRTLWPPEGFGGQTIMGFRIPGVCEPLSIPFPGGGANVKNGELVGGDFTRSAATLADRMQDIGTPGGEYTFTMGLAALDRALPRAESPSKIRPNAAVIMVIVTDEIEELYGFMVPWLANSPATLSAAQRAELEDEMQPWLDFATKPELGATVFGLYWPPGDTCPGGTEFAQIGHDSDHAVNFTGGQGGNVCNADVTGTFRDVALAAGGLASGLRLNGFPFAPSVQVEVERSAGTIDAIERRREDGFDYDPSQNRVIFHEGPNSPLTNQRITVPYLRWDQSQPPCVTVADCPEGYKSCYVNQCR